MSKKAEGHPENSGKLLASNDYNYQKVRIGSDGTLHVTVHVKPSQPLEMLNFNIILNDTEAKIKAAKRAAKRSKMLNNSIDYPLAEALYGQD